MKQARGLIIEKKKKENVLSIKGPYGGKHCWVNEDLVVISGSVPLRSQSVMMMMIFFYLFNIFFILSMMH